MNNLQFWNPNHKQFVDRINNERKKYNKEWNIKKACKTPELKIILEKYLEKKREFKAFKKAIWSSPYDISRWKEWLEEYKEYLISKILEPYIKENEKLLDQ